MSLLFDFICLVGSLLVFKVVVDNGVDVVYFGYKNDINVCNFVGFNFDVKSMVDGICYVYVKGCEVLFVINIFVQVGCVVDWQKVVDVVVDQGVDVIILVDVGFFDYVCNCYL